MCNFRTRGIRAGFELFKKEAEDIINRDIALDQIDGDENVVIIRVDNGNGDILAEWTMFELPGNCGIAVSSSVWIDGAYRGWGLNGVFNKMRQKMAHFSGYGGLIATTVSDRQPGAFRHQNDRRRKRPENATLRSRGFKSVKSLINLNSGNRIQVWFKDLTEGEP